MRRRSVIAASSFVSVEGSWCRKRASSLRVGMVMLVQDKFAAWTAPCSVKAYGRYLMF